MTLAGGGPILNKDLKKENRQGMPAC